MSTTDGPAHVQVRFPIAPARIDELLADLDDIVASVAAYEASDGSGWLCELLFYQMPDLEALQARLVAALGEDAPAPAALSVGRLLPKDWLEATRRSFPPLAIGRFWIRGSHIEAAAPAGTVPLLIDAGTAFGSGEHGSTTGCLHALHDLARRQPFSRVLDMGCGSAILAIAALKCWPQARAYACDIDADAVRTAAVNGEINGVARRLTTAVCDGYDRPELRRSERFDLVFANILAGPLVLMAPDLARSLAKGGRAILAGLLSAQADSVLIAHRRQGLHAAARYEVGPWTTLVLTKPRTWRPRRRVRPPSPFAVERWPTRTT
jgi:ribosomal protein L11 methyltransferase